MAEQGVIYFSTKKARVPLDVVIVALLSGFAGALIGVPIPILGSLMGLVLGIFLGGLFYAFFKLRNWSKALKMAKAALLSQVLATGVKSMIGLGMIVFILFHLF